MLLRENAHERRIVVKHRRDVCEARQEKRLGDGVVRGAKIRALDTLAFVSPVTMVGGLTSFAMRVPVARRTGVVPHPLGMPRVAGLRTIVRVVRAATDDEVNHQDHGTQIVEQTGHRKPLLRGNSHRQVNYTVLSQINNTTCEVAEACSVSRSQVAQQFVCPMRAVSPL